MFVCITLCGNVFLDGGARGNLKLRPHLTSGINLTQDGRTNCILTLHFSSTARGAKTTSKHQ